MSIWITGDIHGEPRRFNTESFYEQSNTTKDDVMIICGDFGLVWDYTGEGSSERWWLNWLENKPWTTVFLDGNHENFHRLNAYPVKEWNGGLVHEIRPHVLHLMRGEVFTIEGKTFFAMGGASSHDISDGIIDSLNWKEESRKFWEAGKRMYRIKGISWWEEELPSDEELENGIKNLTKCGNTVDFIITHSPPASVIALLGQGRYKQDKLTQYLEEIRATTSYQKWFMGHMHVNKAINNKELLLYEQIIQII